MLLSLQAIMDNGPAKKKKMSQTLQEVGHSIGDLFEISNIRREVKFYRLSYTVLIHTFYWGPKNGIHTCLLFQMKEETLIKTFQFPQFPL